MSINPEIEQLIAVVDALPDPVFVLTESGRYAGIVGGKDSRYYHDGSFLVGKSMYDVLPKEKADWFLEQVKHALDEQRLWTVEYELGGTDVDGLDVEQGPPGMLWFEGRIHPLASLYEGERAVVWVARNITRRYELEAELRHLSVTDVLTGTFNRRKFLEELGERYREFQRYKEPVALIMLDIDHFKTINDRYGHMVGDKAICHVADLCNKHLRNVDFLSRFGGEEFAVLLPNTNIESAQVTGERLRLAVEENAASIIKEEMPVTVSAGVSALASGDTAVEDVIKRADDALYEAKRSGRNRVMVSYPK